LDGLQQDRGPRSAALGLTGNSYSSTRPRGRTLRRKAEAPRHLEAALSEPHKRDHPVLEAHQTIHPRAQRLRPRRGIRLFWVLTVAVRQTDTPEADDPHRGRGRRPGDDRQGACEPFRFRGIFLGLRLRLVGLRRDWTRTVPRSVSGCAPGRRQISEPPSDPVINQRAPAARAFENRRICAPDRSSPRPRRDVPQSWPDAPRATARSRTGRGHNGHTRGSFGFARVRSHHRITSKCGLSTNGRERARTLLPLAMQKVVGSSPIIRSESSCKNGRFRSSAKAANPQRTTQASC
jgi:hypothetical protein